MDAKALKTIVFTDLTTKPQVCCKRQNKVILYWKLCETVKNASGVNTKNKTDMHSTNDTF